VLPSGALDIGPFLVSTRLLIGGIFTVVLATALHLFFTRSRRGLRLAAVAEDHNIALSLGVSVRSAIAVAWILERSSPPAAPSCCCPAAWCRLKLPASVQGVAGGAAGRAGVGARRPARRRHDRSRRSTGDGLSRSPDQRRFIERAAFAVMIGVLLIRPQGLFGWKKIERL